MGNTRLGESHPHAGNRGIIDVLELPHAADGFPAVLGIEVRRLIEEHDKLLATFLE